MCYTTVIPMNDEQSPINFLKPETLRTDQTIRGGKKAIIVGALALIIIIAFLSTVVAALGTPARRAFTLTLIPKPATLFESIKGLIFHSTPVLAGSENDRINILLLGMGGPGHDGPFLTDTNIIVSIKPSTKEIALVSIPRDLGVKIDTNGWRRINYANSIGEVTNPGQGGEYARKIFEQTFGIAIPYYVRVDFTAFVETINAVGGVSVNVTTAFTDYTFPGARFSTTTVHFEAGMQTMDGGRALTFARSRHGNNGEGSDFARARRQQLVLEALKQKLLSAGTYSNPLTVQQILGSLAEHVTTNLNFPQIMYLGGLAKDTANPIKTLVFDSSPTGFLINTTGDSGAFILAPKNGSFEPMHLAIQNIFGAASSTVAMLSLSTTPLVAPITNAPFVEIQNGTWRAGLAAKIKQNLERAGFSISAIGNSLARPVATTTIYLLKPGVSPSMVSKLSSALRAPTSLSLPEWLKHNYDNSNTTEDERGMKYNNETAILIIIGSDYKE
ncbi:MAG: LytR family transcriptional regulator [Candidatus Magasanikbacteria bacterium]|nr:LytR family transcriptional regulator [Candidatus Magasanikbacteria bacterium]